MTHPRDCWRRDLSALTPQQSRTAGCALRLLGLPRHLSEGWLDTAHLALLWGMLQPLFEPRGQPAMSGHHRRWSGWRTRRASIPRFPMTKAGMPLGRCRAMRTSSRPCGWRSMKKTRALARETGTTCRGRSHGTTCCRWPAARRHARCAARWPSITSATAVWPRLAGRPGG